MTKLAKRNQTVNGHDARSSRRVDSRVYLIVLLIIISLGLVYVAKRTRAQSDGGGSGRSLVVQRSITESRATRSKCWSKVGDKEESHGQ